MAHLVPGIELPLDVQDIAEYAFCEPEGLETLGLVAENIYLSMERNMQCAVGHCGHCQIGAHFVCRNGPVFRWPEIRSLLGKRGF